MSTANEKLMVNLENQLDRLVEQLKDLEECRNEISKNEFDLIKEDTIEQIKEFSETLDRMQKGDTTLNNKLSNMKKAIRTAIATSFNTEEMIKLFGAQGITELEGRLQQLEQSYKLRKIENKEYEKQKVDILSELQSKGCKLSSEQTDFLQNVRENFMDRLEQVQE